MLSYKSIKTFLRNAFIICALFVLFVPIFTFNIQDVISEKENRYLTSFPAIIKDNHLNSNFFKECNSYFSDRFGLRQYFIAINNLVNTKLHANKGIQALQGKNGWYFYINKADGDNYADFMKQNLLLPETLMMFKENVKNTADWCEANGIKTIFLICPNKHNIYSEFYPFPRPDGITRADQLTTVFNELGVNYIFPRDYILLKKTSSKYPLYYETDTHWNPLGAYCAFELLKTKIEALFPIIDFPEISYKISIEYSDTAGDILPMMNVSKSKSTRPSLSPNGETNADYYEYIKNDGRHVITKGKNRALPRAIIFRDSFFIALEPFTSPLFSEAEYIWRAFSDSDKEYILKNKPDIIIFEEVERHGTNLVHCSK